MPWAQNIFWNTIKRKKINYIINSYDPVSWWPYKIHHNSWCIKLYVFNSMTVHYIDHEIDVTQHEHVIKVKKVWNECSYFSLWNTVYIYTDYNISGCLENNRAITQIVRSSLKSQFWVVCWSFFIIMPKCPLSPLYNLHEHFWSFVHNTCSSLHHNSSFQQFLCFLIRYDKYHQSSPSVNVIPITTQDQVL